MESALAPAEPAFELKKKAFLTQNSFQGLRPQTWKQTFISVHVKKERKKPDDKKTLSAGSSMQAAKK
jgi:hypothetical protein